MPLIMKIRSRYVAPFWKRIYSNMLFSPLRPLSHIQILSCHHFMFDGLPKLCFVIYLRQTLLLLRQTLKESVHSQHLILISINKTTKNLGTLIKGHKVQ